MVSANYHDIGQLLLLTIIVSSKNCTILIIGKENIRENWLIALGVVHTFQLLLAKPPPPYHRAYCEMLMSHDHHSFLYQHFSSVHAIPPPPNILFVHLHKG